MDDYLKGIFQISNAIVAAVYVQSITFVAVVFNVDPLRKMIMEATPYGAYVPPLMGWLVYSLLVTGCWKLEMKLLADRGVKSTATWLWIGRLVSLAFAIAPLLLAFMAIRHKA